MADTVERRIINRAGFFRTDGNGCREYLVLPEAFKQEVSKGFDYKAVESALLKAGWLEPGEGTRKTQKPRIPGFPPTRCYVINSKLWGHENEV